MSCPWSHIEQEQDVHVQFERASACMAFVVDYKPLAEVTYGYRPLAAPCLAPLFNRVTTRLFEFVDMGQAPHTTISDPILWQRRQHNLIADVLLNHGMVTRSSWLKEVQPAAPNFTVSDANIICSSDGCTRAGSCSA